MQSLSRYFHTVRHLKAEQIIGQVRRRLPRAPFVPVPSQSRRSAARPFDPGYAMPPVMTAPDAFILVGEAGSLERGWNDPEKSALWRYNLHYFDDLRRDNWAARRSWHSDLIDRWLLENPPVAGEGWAPYPTSLRIVNWMAWDLAGGALSDSARLSLGNQAGWLSSNLETHILGNHLFANLKALIFAGSYFSGATADRWLSLGVERFHAELAEQVLPDGGNFELSPMYHAIFLSDLLDLVALDRVFPGRLLAETVRAVRGAAERMLGWLEAMTHPDGDASHFNDCALGVAPRLAELLARGKRFGITALEVGHRIESSAARAIHLAESGYVRLEAGDAVALCDVGEVGPSYLPGHAHADTLSYELSFGRRRIVVNGGTSCYGSGAVRLRERGTAAHSTVEVAEADSSEVWSGFRVARRAHPFDVWLSQVDGTMRLTAAHDGYRRLPGRPIHRRCWTMRADSLEVSDRVDGSQPAVARHILHPEASEMLPDELSFRVLHGTERRAAAFYSQGFGEPGATTSIDVVLTEGRGALQWAWR